MSVNFSALPGRVKRGLGRRITWRIVLGLFVVEAVWFVLSARYPMAFDEDYHFGLIQLHAHQWLPYFTSQPDGAGAYGAIVRDPSYLYHWLMSYPYRLITVFTHNQTAQVIILRLLNVGLFVYGLTLYRRLVRRLGVSQALTNGLFALLILIPVVPFLAATINYDNLFFVAVAGTALLTLRLKDDFQEKRVNAAVLLVLVAVLFLSSLIKYAYLPVFAVTAIFVLGWLWRARLLSHVGWRSFSRSFGALNILKRVALVLVVLVAVGLFVERYGENIITYHNPVPSCDAVISEDECAQYGPYERDYHYEQSKPVDFHPHIWTYIYDWLSGMWQRLFFAINYNYANEPPLLIIGSLAILLALWALVGIALRFRALFSKHPVRQYVLWLTLGYVAVLFLDGFSSYVKTAEPVAINGRYLIPFLPFLFAFGGLAWSQLLRSRPGMKSALVTAVLAIFVLQGGGTMTFITQSNDSWMWNNSAVQSVNRTVRNVARPLMIGKRVFP